MTTRPSSVHPATMHPATTARRHRVVGACVALLAALTLALGLVTPAQAATTYTLDGTVTSTSGHPLAGIRVTLSTHPADEDEASVVARVRTDSGGHYTFKGVPRTTTKDYFLSATDPTGHHVERYSASFALTASATRDLTLRTAGFIQGTVSTKAPGGTAKPGSSVLVTTLSADEATFASAKVAANGKYRIGGLPAGTYRVQYQDTEGVFEGLCYDGVRWPTGSDVETCATTTPVVVKAGRVTELNPQTLTRLR